VVGIAGIPGTVHLIHIVQAPLGAALIGSGLVIEGIGEALFFFGAIAPTRRPAVASAPMNPSPASDTRACPSLGVRQSGEPWPFFEGNGGKGCIGFAGWPSAAIAGSCVLQSDFADQSRRPEASGRRLGVT
jgi:hypothetical protein